MEKLLNPARVKHTQAYVAVHMLRNTDLAKLSEIRSIAFTGTVFRRVQSPYTGAFSVNHDSFSVS